MPSIFEVVLNSYNKLIDWNNKMVKVITYGSFDLFHEGHYNLLKRAKELGDYLIVGVTTEQYDESRGKVGVVDSLMTRIDNVRKTGFADEVIIEDHGSQKVEDIQKYNIDIFTVGSDWIGTFDHLNDYCKVVYLERTKGISSTMLRQKNAGIVRLGIVGSGKIAKRFLAEVKHVSGIHVEAIYNPNLESAKRLAESFQIEYSTEQKEVLYGNCDAVYVATPHEFHYEYTKEALLAGKHVLCEKPMVFSKAQAEELFALAAEKKLVLMEALKTAYFPGFVKLIGTVKSGNVGSIRDVEACFTKLIPNANAREWTTKMGGSFTELGSYPLIAIIKTLGRNYKNVQFTSFVNEKGLDLYTKAYIEYNHGIATAKVGMGVKSEGELVISGTKGYLLAESPWWLTKAYELRYEDFRNNEKFYTRLDGEGFRYELAAFVAKINGRDKYDTNWTNEDSIVLAEIMEKFISGEYTKKLEM